MAAERDSARADDLAEFPTVDDVMERVGQRHSVELPRKLFAPSELFDGSEYLNLR